MAYGDTVDPTSRVISIVLVGLVTFLFGWLLVSGLAIDIVKQAVEKLDVMNVEEPPPRGAAAAATRKQTSAATAGGYSQVAIADGKH